MSRTMHPAIADLVATRRLGSLDASRHRFTVSRDQALLQLRAMVLARSPEPWAWTLPVVRAANAVSELAEVRMDVAGDEATMTTTFDVIVPGFELDGIDLSDILAGALEPDLGEPIGLDADPDARQTVRLRRFRMLIGRAINEALAAEPFALELETPGGGRRFERREQVQQVASEAPRDPFAERKIDACVGSSRFVVRWVELRPGWGRRVGRWLRRQSTATAAVVELVANQLIRESDDAIVGDDGQICLAPMLARPAIALGRHARFGPSLGIAGKSAIRGSLWLSRDGIKLVDLGPSLQDQGLGPALAGLSGWVDCPTLKLTADERSVVRDRAFDLLVAWLHDVVAHRSDTPDTFEVVWPEQLERLTDANGRAIAPAEFAADIEHGRERVYVWRHRMREVPAYARAKVIATWPSELDRLRTQHPAARLVPLQALGGQPDFDPADLTSLRAGSHDPLVLVRGATLELDENLQGLRLAIEAYIHRSPTATLGFIELLAYERRIATERERTKVIPGVTLIARLDSSSGELDVPALRRAHATTAAILEHARRVAVEHREALLAHVIARGNAWENPLVRGALDDLDGAAIELHYARLDVGLRLAWKDSVLLDVEVARDGSGATKSLRDALRQLREPGMIILAKDERAYPTLRSADPRLQPWIAIDWARPLLERVVGASSIVEMPVVPEAHPLVGEQVVAAQRHLVRARETIAAELERRNDRLARLRLLGHLLVSRGLELDGFGLEGVALLDRYDPRALSPSRLVSLAAAVGERPLPGLVPVGAVHRGLASAVLEVGPGVAALLGQVAGFEPHRAGSVVGASPQPEARGHAPVRRRARELPPLLARSVVHSLFVGRLQVAGDGSSDGIALWSKGLRVGEIELEEPLGRVSGRLWLTADGQRSGPLLMRKEIIEHARSLVADALHQRALLAPDGPQRARLDHFVEYARAIVIKDDRYRLAVPLGAGAPLDRAERIATLKQMSLQAVPLRPLQARRDALLADIVKQSLAMPVRFDAGMLQWRPAKLGRRRRDGSLAIEFGLRNRWIQQALDEDHRLELPAHREAALRAGVIVVAEFFLQTRAMPELELGPEHLVVALWRLLRLSG